MYRTPPNPGFLGGYNWTALAAGFVFLFAVNITATQFIAARFHYQPALGKPLIVYRHMGVYQPLAWAQWLMRYGGDQNPRVRMPILFGALIVVFGSAVTVGVAYALNLRRTRKLSEGMEDLHGSARWATGAEIEATGLLTSTQGVYVGGWRDPDTGRLHYLRHNGPEHVLAFAPTRSGKGVGLVIPTLLAWSESAVIYDIKGENWAKTAGFRAQAGHVCLKFSPVEESNGSRFNPLAEIRIGTLREVSDAQNAAQMIVRTGDESPEEEHWKDTAESITTGMILHVLYAAIGGRTATLSDLASSFTRPGQDFRETLAALENYPHDPSYHHGWQTTDGEPTATHPVVREKAREMLDKEDRELSGVLSTAKTALSLYIDPLVARNMSGSDFTIDDLVNHSRPISLYLVVPNSDRERLRRLMRLIFTMMVNRLTERMEFDEGAHRRNRYRLLFMIDEFPSLKRMEIFANALSYMGGYGLKAYLITQDIRQIVNEYGPNESVVSNCHVRIAYTPNQYDTAELLSKMAGTKTVQKASFSFSGSRLAPIANHMNASVEQIERPLITPDEVLRLRSARKEGDGDSERIVAPGDMLIFVSGSYPIHGTQMLYFTDAVLAKRAAMAPPTEFPAVPPHKSICEEPVSTATASPAERAFVAEMQRGATGFIEQLELDYTTQRKHEDAEKPD